MVKTQHTGRTTKFEGWLLLGGAALILGFLFFKLYGELKPQLDRTELAMKEGRAIKLQSVIDKDALKKILANGGYYTDDKDVNLLADSLSLKLFQTGELDNLGSLNKNSFSVIAPVPWKSNMGGIDFQNRLRASRQLLGFDSALYNRELTNPVAYPAKRQVSTGNVEMKGRILSGGFPMSGVLIQLREHIALEEEEEDTDEDSIPEPIAWARTNANGEFSFTGLNKDSGYSVLPMKPGFEFGSRQGTRQLNKNASFTFTAKPHKVRLVGTIAYSQIKQDGLIIVRTPEEFTTSYQLIAGGLILSFFIVHLVLSLRKKKPDVFLLPALMLLCGISTLLMLSIQDPLTDTLHGWQTLQGVIAGLIGYTILCCINIGSFYTKWWFDPIANYRSRNVYRLKGWTWLALAMGIAILTAFIGTGPEGSGVKVNIQLGGLTFQPGEITKYLLLFFLAGFFAANAENLRNLSDIRWRFLTNIGVFAGIGAILALYLYMGDMGPAMVICFTFLFFYSIANNNLFLTIMAGVVYCLLLWLVPGWMATIAAFLLVLITLAVQGKLRSTRWYGPLAVVADAPVIVLIIIAAFAFGDRIPGIGERLADRKQIWLSQWNNDVFGGDHLAHSYWTLSSGGLTGQGIGRGYSNTMPAAHTDMILPSIGEELGWIGLVAVFLLYGILIHRSFLYARRSGQPFAFYLCAGIAIATGIQLLLIAGGSIGLVPLTGITVPFLSYGKISLIINLAAMGIIAGISARAGQQVQQEYVRKNYDPVLMTGILFFMTGIVVLAVKLFFVQVVDRREYLVKQARVVMRNGVPVYSYNPRIDKLMRLLAAGNIYDRNGLILATSETSAIQQNMDSLQKAGLTRQYLQDLLHKRERRIYPFAEQLFFWTGDYNTRLFWGQSNGYFAEAKHLTALRGFGVSHEIQDSVHTLYHPDRFTKPYYKTVPLARYDYSALTDCLQAGLDTNYAAIKKIRDKDRNVHLTVDAGLQVELQDSLHTSLFKNKRVSVVVLDASTGDILASALNPLPDLHSPELMELPDRERNKLETPVTERDLGMTFPTAPGSAAKILTAMAGLNKMGLAATELKYTDIYRSEIFRDNKREQEPFIPKVQFVNMHEAIVNSSNIFFIRLANENDLEDQMASLYQSTGMYVEQRGGYDYTMTQNRLKQSADLAAWRKDIMNHDRRLYNNPENFGKKRRYRSTFSGLAWGQSVLTSTPASMARMAGAIANHGTLQPSRYVLQESGQSQEVKKGVQLANDTGYASILRQYMVDQSSTPGKQKIRNMVVAGKTGTPERIINGVKQSDGWYVFFAPRPDNRSYTVACIRIETGQSSANAVLVANTVANILKKRDYMTSF